MSLPKHHLELLSPARDTAIAREAILHGADAVYIGGPSFGARHNAENSVEEIARLVEFAHLFHARVFVTLNTILHDDELALSLGMSARRFAQRYHAWDSNLEPLASLLTPSTVSPAAPSRTSQAAAAFAAAH